MSNQLFKNNTSIDFLIKLFIEFLDKTCEKNNNIYKFDRISYRKSEFHNHLNEFIEKITPFYYESKKYYLTRNMKYNYFITIIRQICKFCNIKYVNKIEYDKSKYDINYYIYID